ncbi:MAG: hypothetical protein ACTHMI_19495 [Mucilaginibacter sp.]
MVAPETVILTSANSLGTPCPRRLSSLANALSFNNLQLFIDDKGSG